VIGKCRSCGRSVSVEEPVCPHCGARGPVPEEYRAKPYSSPDRTSGGCLGVILLVVSGGALVLLSRATGLVPAMVPW
jgi:hypothetical protein